jgi:hypothetical protein
VEAVLDRLLEAIGIESGASVAALDEKPWSPI